MARRSPNSSRPVRPTSTPAKRKGIPLTPLAQRMLHDLQLAGRAERTQESYLRQVRKFAQWLMKSPDVATEDELRRYLLYIKNDQQWAGNSLKVTLSLVYVLLVGAQPLPVPHRPRCPHCGAELTFVRFVPVHEPRCVFSDTS